MASVAARHARHHEPRLFRGPAVFERRRKVLAELVACVWLAVEIARLVRRRVTRQRAGAEA